MTRSISSYILSRSLSSGSSAAAAIFLIAFIAVLLSSCFCSRLSISSSIRDNSVWSLSLSSERALFFSRKAFRDISSERIAHTVMQPSHRSLRAERGGIFAAPRRGASLSGCFSFTVLRYSSLTICSCRLYVVKTTSSIFVRLQ